MRCSIMHWNIIYMMSGLMLLWDSINNTGLFSKVGCTEDVVVWIHMGQEPFLDLLLLQALVL